MRQFLRITIFISLLNLYMQKNGAVWGKILNVNKNKARNGIPEEGAPSESEHPTSAQKQKDEDSNKEVMKQTTEDITKFTDEAKEEKNKTAHESLKITNQHVLEPVEISSQDADKVNGKNEEVEEEVQTMEVEDDVDEEEEQEEDDDGDDDDDYDDGEEEGQQLQGEAQEGEEVEKAAQEGKDASPNGTQAHPGDCQCRPDIEEYFNSTEGPLKDLIKIIKGDKELENRMNDIIKIMVLFFLQL
ncbi:Uncharacterized protein PCOAH_00031420 [Plasmodium coatneyi]|uniref:Merozoite surface protein 3 n=1 Tax=Plasmodium coatneyi TaxID=208452 RepID=A0A1B1E137_9APIC|nr:Uncharacterized protein PCOAH_00031420 [Plasmodium coatneyi]ANQ08595.1 Uncharacterized protein PCOAH_00031420 [Plasmodium coatneyi]